MSRSVSFLLLVSAMLLSRADETPTKSAAKPLVVTTPEWKPLEDDPLPDGAICRMGYARARHGIVTNLAATADGKLLAAGFGDHGVRVWEADSGKLVRAWKPLADPIRKVVITSDGRTAAAISADKIHYWTVAETAHKPTTLEGHPNGVSDIAFSSDGKSLISTGWIGGVRLWNVVEGKLSREFLTNERANKPEIAFTPDGKRFLVCDEDGIRMFSISNGELVRTFEPIESPREVLVLADGKTVVARSALKGVFIWNIDSGKLTKKITDLGDVAAISSDGSKMAVEDLSKGAGEIRIHDVNSHKVIRVIRGYEATPSRLVFSPDAQSLWSMSNGILKNWDLSTGELRTRSIGHQGQVTAATFTPDGKSVLSASFDGTIRFWDPTTGKELRRISTDHELIRCLALSPDAKALAIGMLEDNHQRRFAHHGLRRLTDEIESGHVRSWNLVSESESYCLDLPKSPPVQIRFEPDGNENTLMTLIGGNTIQRVNLKSGNQKVVIRSRKRIRAAATSPDDARVSTVVWGGVGYWETNTQTATHGFLSGGRENLTCVAISPDGSAVAEVLNNKLRLREVPANSRRFLKSNEDNLEFPESSLEINTIAYSPDGRLIAAANLQGVSIFETTTGQLRRRFTGGHGDGIYCIAFSPDSRTLVSGGDDGVLVAWDVVGTRGVDKSKPLEGRDLESAWSAFAELDGEPAGRAMALLAAREKKALPFLKAHLGLVSDVDLKRIEALIKDFDNDAFRVRDQAARALTAMGQAAIPVLKRALATNLSPEARTQTERIIERFNSIGETSNSPIPRRDWRAIEVIERIGTPEAITLLEDIRRHAPRKNQGSEAEKALQRLSKRSRK